MLHTLNIAAYSSELGGGSIKLPKNGIFKQNRIVMKENVKRNKWINIRLSDIEYQELQRLYKKSNCQNYTQYARKVLLQKPVILKYRNTSMDDFMQVCIQLNKEFNAIGNNFNQAVHRLHILDQRMDVKAWMVALEIDRKIMLDKVGQIYQTLKIFTERWSQD